MTVRLCVVAALAWMLVASTSAVLVVVIDCTDTGASPPTVTGLVG